MKRKTRLKTVIIAAIVVTAVVGFIAYSIGNTGRNLKALLDLGEKYINSLEYDEAVTSFAKALEIDPDSETAKEGLLDAYKKWYENEMASENIDGIKTQVAIWKQEFPDNKQLLSLCDESDREIKGMSQLANYMGLFEEVTEYYGGDNLESELSPLFRTIHERREAYAPLINDLEQYLTFLQNHDIPQLTSDANSAKSVEIRGNKYISLSSAYSILCMMYADIGDEEKRFSLEKDKMEYLYGGESIPSPKITITKSTYFSGKTLTLEASATSTDEYNRFLTGVGDDGNLTVEYKYDEYGQQTYNATSWREDNPDGSGTYVIHWETWSNTYESGRLVKQEIQRGDDYYGLKNGVPYNTAVEEHDLYGIPYPAYVSVTEYNYSGDTVTENHSGISGYGYDGATREVTINYIDLSPRTFGIDKYGRPI